jgi:tetratricopeptide (TPR) repeat protein
MKAAVDMAPDEGVVLQESADLRAVWCRTEKPPPNCDDLRATARAQYQKLLSIEPDRIEAEAALGALLNDMGDPTDAAIHLERAYAAAPWYVPTIAELGLARESAGHTAEATPMLRRALAWVESDAALAKRLRAALRQAEGHDAPTAPSDWPDAASAGAH